ncbi:hypothetical protein BDQ17DRAFT_1540159 [Cyathus striatus]|nr:hypothetical protein BDQ17DRAFT_1540159 [Cyathus striatus]
MLTITKRHCAASISSSPSWLPQQARAVSSSPYGRTHVWKRRDPVLPKPVVPKYPQVVVRADGSSFTHWTTSPRSIIRLVRDLTTNPVWNGNNSNLSAFDEESGSTGRMGRYNRKFEKDSKGSGIASDEKWFEEIAESTKWSMPTIDRNASTSYGGKKKK